MKLHLKAALPRVRKPKWAPDIKVVKQTKVLLPDIQIRGVYQDLIADVMLDPISQGYEAVVEIMGTVVKAWGLRIKEAQDELIEKVRQLCREMGWDIAPKYASCKGTTIIFRLLESNAPKTSQHD
jgi:hypothetical protein